MGKAITICDIAKEAGVSISTVSRVLTGNARVKEDKKQRIREIINKYDFHPNLLARGLIQTKTMQIGIITADVCNPYYSAMFVSCEKAANSLGYTLLLSDSFGDRGKEFELLEKMVSQRVDAIILIGGLVDELVTDTEFAEKVNLITNQIPVIVTGRLDGTNCSRVNIDGNRAMELVMEYLISCRYKKIAFAGGSPTVKFTTELRAAYHKLLKSYGFQYNPAFDVPNQYYDENGGYAAMSQILKEKELPDAVIAVNDLTAAGVMRAVTEHHLRIPEDIGVISFDNTYIAPLVTPQLTSVGYNYDEYGKIIVKNAVAAIAGDGVPHETLIEPEIAIRQSCRAR